MSRVICAWAAFACSFGAAGHAATATERTLLVVGDSISAAYGIKAEEGWVALLQARLRQQGYGYRVVNASVSGETTSGGLARLPRALKLHQPHVVIIELGGNDGLRGIPLTLTRSNLDAMIRQSRGVGARVLLAGMKLPPNYGARYTSEFERTFADLAREHRTAFVPFMLEDVALDPRLMQADGLHPTADAQPTMLDAVWPALVPLLAR
jgi:acyl-CoA thioesterase-1